DFITVPDGGCEGVVNGVLRPVRDDHIFRCAIEPVERLVPPADRGLHFGGAAGRSVMRLPGEGGFLCRFADMRRGAEAGRGEAEVTDFAAGRLELTGLRTRG